MSFLELIETHIKHLEAPEVGVKIVEAIS